MKKISLSMQMLLATVLAIFFGIFLQSAGLQFIATDYLKYAGILFMNFIKVIIIPLIVCAVIMGMRSLGGRSGYGKRSVSTVVIFLIMTAIAATIGLVIGSLSGVGSGFTADLSSMNYEAPKQPGMIDTIINFVPSNIFASLGKGNMVQIILFTLLFGWGMMSVGEKANDLFRLVDATYEVIMKITGAVMKWAPIGIFAIVTETFTVNGLEIILPMLQLVVLIYVGFFVHNFLVYGIGVRLFAGIPIGRFYRESFRAQLFGFTSQTSSAAIPFLEEAADRLGISKAVHSFVIPFGSAVHKDGTALYQSVMVVFLANLLGVQMSLPTMAMVVFSATLASIGTAGVPQGGMVTLSLVLTTAGIPVESISLVAGLISVIGMGSTMNNVAGDLATAAIVDAKFSGRETSAKSPSLAADAQ